MIVWLLCFRSCKPITRACVRFHMPVVWFAASFFSFFFFTHPRGSSREGWSACQQGAGKRLVFNLIRADSIAWNCGREARSFVLVLNFSTARKASSLLARLLLFSLFFFFLQGRFASRSTSACTAGSRSIRIGIAFDRNSIKKCPTPPFRPKFPIFGTIFLRTYGRTPYNCLASFIFSNKFVFREISRFDRRQKRPIERTVYGRRGFAALWADLI